MGKLNLGIAATLVALLAGSPAAEANTLVSAMLEGPRIAYMTCEVINKSGGLLDDVVISLKGPDAAPITPSTECDGLIHGATCALTYTIIFPAQTAAYCHVTVPDGKFVRGNLRFQDQQKKTLSESSLEGDIHGKLAALSDKIDALSEGAPMFPDDGVGPLSHAQQGAALSYVDNGDGTVTDVNTKLVWAKKSSAGSVTDSCLDYPHASNPRCTWPEAKEDYLQILDYTCDGEGVTSCLDDSDCAGAETCGYAGHQDWCIPDAKALQSIVDYSITGAKFDPVFGSVVSPAWWTGTPFTATQQFHITSAGIVTLSNSTAGGNVNSVRAVRGSCFVPPPGP